MTSALIWRRSNSKNDYILQIFLTEIHSEGRGGEKIDIFADFICECPLSLAPSATDGKKAAAAAGAGGLCI